MDSWHCYGCSRDVTRQQLEAITAGLIQWPPQCFDCGPQAVVVDMKLTPPTIAGCTCFRHTDTYLQPIACLTPWYSAVDVEVASSSNGDLDDIEGIEELRSMVQQHQDDDVRELETLAAGWLSTSQS